MSWLYITEPGARLGKKGGSYVISRENEVLCEIPSQTVEGITMIDTAHVTSSVIVNSLKCGVPITWLSSEGKFYGRLESTQFHDVFREKEQFDILKDEDFRIRLARMVVFRKVYNQRAVLRNYNRRTQNDEITRIYDEIRIVADHLHSADSIDKIMGYEGYISRLYFKALGKVLPDAFSFDKRTRQPPKDKFNSLLSFGYTLLMYDFYTSITNAGLNPYVGFLHSLKNGHPALASDLMEPWRPAVIDTMCLSLVSHHEIKEEHFESDSQTGGVYLSKVGRRIFLRAYEQRMRTENKYFNGSYSWRHTVQMECDSYRQCIHEKDPMVLRALVIR